MSPHSTMLRPIRWEMSLQFPCCSVYCPGYSTIGHEPFYWTGDNSSGVSRLKLDQRIQHFVIDFTRGIVKPVAMFSSQKRGEFIPQELIDLIKKRIVTRKLCDIERGIGFVNISSLNQLGDFPLPEVCSLPAGGFGPMALNRWLAEWDMHE